MWYLQFHFVCAKLLLSIYMASFVVMRSANLHIFYRRRLYFLLIAVSFPEPRAQRVVFFLQKKASDEIVGSLMFCVVETRGIEPLTSKMRI